MRRTVRGILASLAVVSALLGASMPAAAQDYITLTVRSCDLNRATKTFRAYLGASEYALLNTQGETISKPYASISSRGYGFFEVEEKNGTLVENTGIINALGEEVIPPIYGDTVVISGHWLLGIRVVPCEEIEKDYTVYSNSEKLFYKIDTVDFYFDGSLVGTLPRESYNTYGATAYGKYIRVEDRLGKRHFYNSAFEPSPVEPDQYLSEYESDYFNGKNNYIHNGSGQEAFVPTCTLTADEVANPYLYSKGVMYDLQGNVLFTADPVFDNIYTPFKNGYARAYVYDSYSKYGLVDSEGHVIIPPEYNSIGYSEANPMEYGCISAEKDGMFGFIGLDGNPTSEFTYSTKAVRNRYNFAEVTHIDGTVSVISGLVGELPEHYSEITVPTAESMGARVFIGKNADKQTTLVDLYGRTLLPYSDEYVIKDVSLDGTVALVQGKEGYRIYTFDFPEGLESAAVSAAENAQNAGEAGGNEEPAAVPGEQADAKTTFMESFRKAVIEMNAKQAQGENGGTEEPQPEEPQPETPQPEEPQPEEPQPETPQPEEPQPEAPQPNSFASDGTWTCANGHSGNTGKFCPECGAQKPEPAITECPNCHHAFPEGTTYKFCPECGTQIG